MEDIEVFISWAGPQSKAIAEALRNWLPYVIQACKPWISSYDIVPGARWNLELAEQLKRTHYGIICLTQENLDVVSPWLFFEAGALSKFIDDTYVCPYLFNVKSDIGPLSQFQTCTANKVGTWKLVNSINNSLEDKKLPNEIIKKFFDNSWPDLEALIKSIPQGPPKKDEPIRTFAHSGSAEFAGCFEQMAEKAERIILIGIGINVLHRDTVFIRLMKRVKKKECSLEIYLANPFSPAVEMRLIEEEIGDLKPTVGKVGLDSRLQSYIEEQRKLNNPSNFAIGVFSHYPTFAIIILDDDYFFYPYGYALLGNQSPVFQFSGSNPAHKSMIEFLQEQYNKVRASSADAQLILNAQRGRSISVEKLRSYAVYFVPEEDSEIYRFGSKVLGYDLRKRCALPSTWDKYVGSAADFGFHLTIADALYYPCQRDIDLLCKDLEFIIKDFHPFSLRFEMQERFPNKNSISLVCYDESGILEAMHCELVFRCYRQAVGSNYSLGRTSIHPDLNRPRDKLMTQRYHAPYILQMFKPHFTLLANVPTNKMEEVALEVKELYHQEVKEQQIDIKYIAVMDKPQQDLPWKIRYEVKLDE